MTTQVDRAAGRHYNAFKDLSVTAGATYVIKMAAASSLLLYGVRLSTSTGIGKVSLVQGGTEGGSYSESISSISRNQMPSANALASATTITAGGTLTGGTTLDIMRVGTSVQALVTPETSHGEGLHYRGLAPGSYYLKVESVGSDNLVGPLTWYWEERT